MNDLNFNFDVPHPGHFIREELEAREWTQRDLAFILGVPEASITQIVTGKRGISTEMAMALSQAFDVSADFFNNLQWEYDKSHVRATDPAVSRRARIQGVFPVREMIKRGWLEDGDIGLLEVQLARFFNVVNVNDVPHLAHAAKKAKYDEILPSQLAWLFRAKQIAGDMACLKYSDRALREAISKLHFLMTDPAEVRHIPRILAECGVRFVLVERLPGAKIDGAVFWLDKQSPVIAMSLLHDRIDNFWFVLRHEIEHVLLKHGQVNEILDDLDGEQGIGTVIEEEKLANDAASNFCIPENEISSFIARKAPFFSERDILGFAKRIQIHPGIVVGQIQKRTDRWDLLKRHQVKIRHFILPSATVDGWGEVSPVNI